jgi:hypothetical protein
MQAIEYHARLSEDSDKPVVRWNVGMVEQVRSPLPLLTDLLPRFS